jgi:glycosyltransferase involved in cell wall biosynthesis
MARKISILVPCYNEQESLPLFYEELSKIMQDESLAEYDWEILFVNDGSKDNTLAVIKALREMDSKISYVDLSRNFGKEKAMLAGFDYVTGDCMIIMDADLQDPPSLIPEMIKWWEQGYDDIYAKRKSRGEESWLRKSFSLLFYSILQKTTKIEILQNVGDFRLLDRSCINALKNIRESERYTKGMFCWIGFKKKEILFDRGDRVAGKSAWNFKTLFALAIEGITSFTTSPLRMSSIFGFIISITAFLYMLYILIKTMIYGDPVQGFPTLIIVILFLGGVQLLSIGILGEYIARIFNETKKRPTYIAREHNGTKLQ